MTRILVVGAGMAGATYARTLADAGFAVCVIDQRDHIAGNCFDSVDPSGVRYHRYGPHLFHTNMSHVVDWLSRFTGWSPYEHRVVARLPDGRLVPMPVNLDTVNAVFDTRFTSSDEVLGFLSSVAVRRNPIVSAEDHLYAVIGERLTDLFFRPYTEKMWATSLGDMAASVVQRLQIRTDRDDRYFLGDTFQALPTDGYTRMFERILNHPAIEVQLSTAYTPQLAKDFAHCFNSMPIDVYFEECFGPLPYRSIRFHHTTVPVAQAQPNVSINYTDSGPMTRETWWHNLPEHLCVDTGERLRTVEEPCDYRDNGFERYYPVKTSDGRYQAIYDRYRAEAAKLDHVSFIGRCGTYQYLDMHQVVNQSLAGCRKWLERNA